MTNEAIRRRARERGVFLWELAARVGVTDSTFSRKLRSEFSPEERERVLRVIGEIASEKEER